MQLGASSTKKKLSLLSKYNVAKLLSFREPIQLQEEFIIF